MLHARPTCTKSDSMKLLLVPAMSLLLAGQADAQNDSKDVAARISAVCPTMLESLLGTASLTKATRQRPISSSVVCSCTMKRLEKDEKLSEYLNSPTRDLASESRNEALQAYLSLLAASSFYACLAPELEASKNAISLVR